MNSQNRRRAFLESLGIGTAGLIVGGYTATAAGFSNSETIRIGLIGCGVRSVQRLLPALQTIPGQKVTAICDIYDTHLEAAKTAVGSDIFSTLDYRELLARKDVDAVIIGSPDHWHVPMTVDACEAGKDVYVEKPLTHSIAEGQSVIDAQDRHQRIVQVGTQQRSMPQFIQARDIVRSGKLGHIYRIRMCFDRNLTPYSRREDSIQPKQVDWQRFLGNAPQQPFDPFIFRNWRWFWDFGGGILTDLMVHWYDAVNFIREMGMPSEITTIGDNFVTKDIWQTPDTVQTILRFPEMKSHIEFSGSIVSAFDRQGITLYGENATLFVDRKILQVTPELRRKVEAIDIVFDDGKKGQTVGKQFVTLFGEKLHLNNWLESVRTRQKPSCPAEAGVNSAKVVHLCNQAFREGKIIRPAR